MTKAAKLIIKHDWESELEDGKSFMLKDVLLEEIQRIRWLTEGINWDELVDDARKRRLLISLAENPKFVSIAREKAIMPYGSVAAKVVEFLQPFNQPQMRDVVVLLFTEGTLRDELFRRAEEFAQKQLDHVKETQENLILKNELLGWKYDKQNLEELTTHYQNILKVGPDMKMLRTFFESLPKHKVCSLMGTSTVMQSEFAMMSRVSGIMRNSMFGAFAHPDIFYTTKAKIQPIAEISLEVPEDMKATLDGVYRCNQDAKEIKSNEKFFKGGVKVVNVNDWSTILKDVETFPGTLVIEMNPSSLTGHHNLLSRIKRRKNIILTTPHHSLEELCSLNGWELPKKTLDVTPTCLGVVVDE